MALDKNRLKEAIKTAYTETAAVETNREDGLDVFAEKLASAIVDEILELSITYVSGLMSGTAAVTGTFKNTLE